MADLKNTFSWSHSRRGVFEECLRRYYLTYYGSWGGWEADAAPPVRAAWVEKKLTTIPMWIGTLVHDAAEGALKRLGRGRPPDPAGHAARVLDRARREIAASAAGEWRRSPGRVTAFQEHYYDEPVPAEAWEEATQEVGRQVRRFFQDPTWRRLRQVPNRILEVEQLEQVDVGAVPVWVRLDALVDDGRGGCVVIDWKTGEAHDSGTIATQLGVYGLYCTIRHGIPGDRVVAMHVNLRSGTRVQHPVSPEILAETRETILRSAAEMRGRLRDPEANVADASDFPPLPENGGTCRRCGFRRSCGREA